MNAEMGPPAPLHQHATPTEIGIMIIVVILAAIGLHYFLNQAFRRTLQKDKFMTDPTNKSDMQDVFKDIADVAGPGPLGDLLRAAAVGDQRPTGSANAGPRLSPDELTMQPVRERERGPAPILIPLPSAEGAVPVYTRAPPPQFSVNDVNKLREQDQTLAQLAVQHSDMVTGPWRYESLASIPDAAVTRTQVGLCSSILSAMMTPISAATSQRGTSARQTLWFMNVGANKVSAADEATCKRIHQQLNTEYFSIIAAHRKATLAAIIKATEPGYTPQFYPVHAACCGQTRVVFFTQDEAEGMAEKLNASYAAIVKPEIDRVLQEIRDEAGR